MHAGALCGSSWWMFVWSTGFTTKCILCALVLLFVAVLTVLINRYIIVKEHLLHATEALKVLEGTQNFAELHAAALLMRGSYPGALLGALARLRKEMAIAEDSPESVRLAVRDLVGSEFEQLISEMVHEMEEFMPLFSVSAAVSPLVGLIGTVLGLINAFASIARMQMVTIAVVAPGIAEALVTTFAGLVVAIAALISYYFIQSKIRLVERKLYLCADRIAFLNQKALL